MMSFERKTQLSKNPKKLSFPRLVPGGRLGSLEGREPQNRKIEKKTKKKKIQRGGAKAKAKKLRAQPVGLENCDRTQLSQRNTIIR